MVSSPSAFAKTLRRDRLWVPLGGYMRVSRVLMAAGLAVLVSVGSVAILSAQAKTDEDYDKLMKAVGAANGAMRGAAKEQNAAGVSAEAAKMVALFKDAQAF